MSKSIDYMKGLIKKFNDNGDYHIGDELSWALEDLEGKEKEILHLKECIEKRDKLLERAKFIIALGEHDLECREDLERSEQWLKEYDELNKVKDI